MGRLPRPTGDDLIYHAINRGNNRADVLGPDGERDMFLGDLACTKARYPFALFGYCLMSNHFHLLLKLVSSGCWRFSAETKSVS